MRSFGLGWALNPKTGILIKDSKGGGSETHRGEDHVKMEAEISVMHLHARE